MCKDLQLQYISMDNVYCKPVLAFLLPNFDQQQMCLYKVITC